MNTFAMGAVAGAAGTMALDMVTYGDMAMRGREASSTPSEMIRVLADKAGIEPLGKPDDGATSTTKNRRIALGAISGYAVGLGVGISYGLVQPYARKLPFIARALAVGGLAMLASDVPAVNAGVTHPSKWGSAGWLADIIPHVMYGFVTASVFDALIAAS